MQKRTCLLIDDSPQESIIERIKAGGRKRHIEIECWEFNVGSQNRQDLLDGRAIDINKVEKAFDSQYISTKFDLIAFDYDLEDGQEDLNKIVTGLTLIKKIGQKRGNSIKLLYSALLKDLLTDIFAKYANSQNINVASDSVRTLLMNGIRDFANREDYDKKIVDLLANNEPTIDGMIEDKLREYSEFTFKSIYPSFKGRTLGEVANMITNDSEQGTKFKLEVIEQAISTMIELNI